MQPPSRPQQVAGTAAVAILSFGLMSLAEVVMLAISRLDIEMEF